MSIWSQHKDIQARITAEAFRLGFDQTQLNDLSLILFRKQQSRLTLPQATRLLIELQGLETEGESLRPDCPLAIWQTKQKERGLLCNATK
jgi:hypothetical protein